MVLKDRTRRPPADLARFVEAANAQVSLRDVSALFTQAMQPFGATAFAVGHLCGGGQPTAIYIATWPRGWIEHYAAAALITVDPVVARAKRSAEPFTWDDVRDRDDPLTERLFDDAARFALRDGFAVPIHGPGDRRGLVALTGLRLRIAPPDRPLVVAAARACHRVARRLFDKRDPSAALSPREREALALVARGHDDAAIGVALGVTRASAHVYVERAKRRLGAATRAQAVALALADGLL